MSRRRTASLPALVLAALGLAAPVPAGAQESEPPASIDRELAEMNREIPGFGGLFYDADGRPSVYLTDPDDPRARARLAAEVRVLPGEFEFTELRAWRRELRGEAFTLPGFVLLDVDESTNRVRVGVERRHVETVRLRLAVEATRRGIPERAIVVEEAEPVFQLATLRDQHLPVPGGVEIGFGSQFIGYSRCTLGFNATRDGVAGFVTNSHCTNRQGGVEGTRYLQPLALPFGTEIATETVDPPYRRGIPGCPGGRSCRYSDSAFAAYDSSDTGDFGRIARTTFRGNASGSITVDPAAPSFAITSTSASAVGHEVNKMGRTTGWTFGAVTATCVDVAVNGTKIVQLCQDWVAAGVGPGDSGSPVFAWDGGSTVSLRGIVWGSDVEGTSYVYSPFANVVRSDELGPLTVH